MNPTMLSCRRLFSSSSLRAAASAAASGEAHAGGAQTWKKLFYIVGIPAIVLGHVNIYLTHGHHDRPEFVKYDYLAVRNKPFPWGDGNHSLFHGPNNALPDGYED